MGGQNTTDWTPTPLQVAVLKAAVEEESGRNISAICQAADCARSTFYDWMRDDEGFRRAWEKLWQSTVPIHMPGIVRAQVEKAEDGDTPAARFCAELTGYLKQKIEHTGKDGGPIATEKRRDLGKLSLEELIQYEALLKKTEG